MPAHKLHYKTDFQGLPISVENKKGSHRHWYDVGEQKAGVTIMKFPYGYVRGTLGTDGDEVDVYIGNDKTSDKVFVITQNKAPDFVKIDEQKVMLGFNSSEQAKLAYLAHMNKPKALRSIKEITMSEFKAKLVSHKGKLIKGALITHKYSAKMGDTVDKALDIQKKFKSDAQRRYMYAAADRGTISRQTVEEFSDKTPKGVDLPERVKKNKNMTTASEDLKDVNKALTAAIAGSIARRARMAAQVQTYETVQRVFGATPVDEVPSVVGIAEDQPQIGTTRERLPNEPPVVPVRVIHNDVSAAPTEPEVFKSCVGCGRMSKGLMCHTCDNTPEVEATPIWRR